MTPFDRSHMTSYSRCI